MKNLWIVAMCVAIVAGLSGEVLAIGAGPTGRVYLGGRYTEGTTRYMRLQSYEIGADWNIVGGLQTHGDLVDNSTSASDATENTGGVKLRWPHSPEISQYGGSGYGKIVVGLWYNNAPLSVYNASVFETMDVLQITAMDGGIAQIDILCDGRGRANGSNEKGTDTGAFAIPDPAGAFTGGPDRYLVNEAARYLNRAWIVTDTHGDGDLTDNDTDYVAELPSSGNTWNGWGFGEDYEILGNKLYRGADRYNGWNRSHRAL